MSYYPYSKRDSIKNYFPLPNEIYRLGLSSGAIAIYGYLLSIEDRETYQCCASYKTIGRAVHMSENTVRKYVTELEESIARQKVQAELSQVCEPQEPLCEDLSEKASPSPAIQEAAELKPFSSEQKA